jgi:hypothetical protein
MVIHSGFKNELWLSTQGFKTRVMVIHPGFVWVYHKKIKVDKVSIFLIDNIYHQVELADLLFLLLPLQGVQLVTK